MESTGRAAFAELVGTFALVFIGAGSLVLYLNGRLDLTGVALANGLVYAIVVSITMHLSGGLANPAVAIGLWITGRIGSSRAVALVVAQLVGAAAGALALRFLVPGEMFDAASGGAVVLAAELSAGGGILIEAIATFLLLFAVYATTVDDRAPARGTAGFTIGLVLACGILALGPYTGAAMNPARWFGTALAAGAWHDGYVWIVGPLAGGAIAAVAYWWGFLRDREPATP